VQVRLIGTLVTIGSIGVDLLNSTTQSVDIKEARELMKKELTRIKNMNLKKGLTLKMTDIPQWRYWRIIDRDKPGLIGVERYHPPNKTMTCQSTTLGNIP
jgi:hypothetical protein